MPTETAPSVLYIMALAVIQGISEFLPVSSSAHLVLFSVLHDTRHAIDVDIAVHFGSLLALMVFCRKDIAGLVGALLAVIARRTTQYTSLLGLLLVASLPVVIIGFFVRYSLAMGDVRSLAWLASANLLFALLLYGADRWGREGYRRIGVALVAWAHHRLRASLCPRPRGESLRGSHHSHAGDGRACWHSCSSVVSARHSRYRRGDGFGRYRYCASRLSRCL